MESSNAREINCSFHISWAKSIVCTVMLYAKLFAHVEKVIQCTRGTMCLKSPFTCELGNLDNRSSHCPPVLQTLIWSLLIILRFMLELYWFCWIQDSETSHGQLSSQICTANPGNPHIRLQQLTFMFNNDGIAQEANETFSISFTGADFPPNALVIDRLDVIIIDRNGEDYIE